MHKKSEAQGTYLLLSSAQWSLPRAQLLRPRLHHHYQAYFFRFDYIHLISSNLIHNSSTNPSVIHLSNMTLNTNQR
jgi:hypothetical protein